MRWGLLDYPSPGCPADGSGRLIVEQGHPKERFAHMRRFLRVTTCVAALLACGCTIDLNATPSSLQADAGEDQVVEQLQTALISGSASRGSPPYLYRWNLNSGPSVDIVDETEAETEVGPMVIEGVYVFRLVVSDADGLYDEDFLTIEVVPGEGVPGVLSVLISGATSLQSGESAFLTANVTGETGDPTYAWEIIEGEGDFGDPTSSGTTVTPTLGFEGTLIVGVTVTDEDADMVATDEHEIAVDIGTFSLTFDLPDVGVAGVQSRVAGVVLGAQGEVDYDWTLLSAPPGSGLANFNCAAIWAVSSIPGTVEFRLTVNDRQSGEELGSIDGSLDFEESIDETFTVTVVSSPPLPAPGEPVSLIASVEGGVTDVSYVWTLVDGSGEYDDPDSPTPTFTPSDLGTAQVRVSVLGTGAGGIQVVTTDAYITTIDAPNPEVIMNIDNYGDVRIQLDSLLAPISTANFLSYVDQGFYDGLVFHRIQTIENIFLASIVQGGGFDQDLERVDLHEPIMSESANGVSNARGTIATVLPNGGADTATSWFNINVEDNSALLDEAETGAAGPAVFGTVTEGMELIDAINLVEVAELCGDFRTGFAFAPVEAVIINSVRRVDETDDPPADETEEPPADETEEPPADEA